MPYTIPNTNRFPIVIPDVTALESGLATPDMLRQLPVAFQVAIEQPADGSDFIVDIPPALVRLDGNYRVGITVGTPNVFTGIAVDFASQTSVSFRVTTDAALPDGTILLISLEALS